MKKSHDCNEVVVQFNLLLDGVLNPKEEQEILCELQRCSGCLQEYNLEDKYRDFIKNRVEKKCIPQKLIEKIQQKCTKGDQ